MTAIGQVGGNFGPAPGLLDREHTIAKAGFNRWLVPPAALCIHLCIGMAYGFSVFWLPLSRALGVTAPKACPDMSLVQELFTTTCDWKVASMGWMYTLFFVLLGIAAAVWGGWLERAGPRKGGFVSGLCCFCHDCPALPLSHSAGRLASGGLDPSGKSQCDDLDQQRSPQRRTQDAAVLADLVGALPQRVRRHRRDRHGLADVAGNL